MLKGEDGYPAQGGRQAARLAAHASRRFDVVNLPNSLLIGLARPAARALGGRSCCTLQGEDLFLDGLPEPYRTESLRADPPAGAGRRSLHRGERLLRAASWRGYLAILPTRSHGAARHHAARLSRALERPRATATCREGERRARDAGRAAVHRRLLRAHRAGERAAPARRGVSRCCAGARAAAGAARGRRLSGARAPRISRGIEPSCAGRAWPRVPLSRRAGSRAEDRVPAAARRALGAEPVREPKGLYLLEAMASGVPVVQPRHGAFPEVIEKTGGGLLVEPDDADSLAEGIWQLYQDRESARGSDAGRGRRAPALHGRAHGRRHGARLTKLTSPSAKPLANRRRPSGRPRAGSSRRSRGTPAMTAPASRCQGAALIQRHG